MPEVCLPGAASSLPGLDPLYTAEQVAGHLGVDVSTCRRLFIDYPGVLKLGRREAHGDRRSYVTLRIPRSVLEKFIRERSR